MANEVRIATISAKPVAVRNIGDFRDDDNVYEYALVLGVSSSVSVSVLFIP